MPKYDRELIARMLEDIASFNHMHGYSPISLNEQARLLREADNLEVDARTVVREFAKREEYEWLDCPLKCSGGECKAKNAGCGSECPRPYRKLSAASGEKGVG